MQTAALTDEKGIENGNQILILTNAEIRILITALEECPRLKKSPKMKRLLKDFQFVPVF